MCEHSLERKRESTVATQIISKGSRAVVVSQYGSRFETRLYVGARDGIQDAVATLVCGTFKSPNGALNWARKQVAA